MAIPARRKCVVKALAIVLVLAPLSGFIGALLGIAATCDGDLGGWSDLQQTMDIKDPRAFVIVAYIHAAGYLGALVGLVLAIVYVRRILQMDAGRDRL
jgi:hypothetical protein